MLSAKQFAAVPTRVYVPLACFIISDCFPESLPSGISIDTYAKILV